MIKRIKIILLFLSLAACTPQQRLQRIINRHPELISADTVKVFDSFITSEVKFDTFLIISEIRDTLKISNDKIKIIIKHDTAFVKVRIPADTIIKEVKIPVKTPVLTVEKISLLEKFRWPIAAFFLAVAGALLLIIITIFRRNHA